eukprot:TRINITY_DN8387_c0_g1_i3.p1 TRINITY_DN8387_c0_g1~~TRINITY_DN8387_c0_g1_i3.p1  ORF type:complete len:585 (+),score=86.03 TRINITY_DN8387_c0_g1_i3:73-1827(+)
MRALRVPRRCGVAATVSQRRTAEALVRKKISRWTCPSCGAPNVYTRCVLCGFRRIDPWLGSHVMVDEVEGRVRAPAAYDPHHDDEIRELALRYGRVLRVKSPPSPAASYMDEVARFTGGRMDRVLRSRGRPDDPAAIVRDIRAAGARVSDSQVAHLAKLVQASVSGGRISAEEGRRAAVDLARAARGALGQSAHTALMWLLWDCRALDLVPRVHSRFCAWHQRQKWLADRWGCAADDGPNASHWTLALRAATISCEETGRRRDATKADSQKLLDSLGRLCASAESTESIWQGTAEASAGLARALMQGLATVEDFKAAYRLLRRASRRGFATPLVWESFVLLVAKVGGPVDLWLDRMRRSRTPIGVRVVNGALRGWVAAGREPEFDVLQRLQVEGLRPDHFTVSLLLSMYSRAARPDDAQRIADAARQWRPPVQLSRAGLTMLIGAHAPACKAPGDRHHRLATQALDEMRERKLFVQLPRERALSGMRWYAECLASAGAVREFETFCDEIHTLHEQLMVSAQHGRGSQVSSLGVSVTSLSNARARCYSRASARAHERNEYWGPVDQDPWRGKREDVDPSVPRYWP